MTDAIAERKALVTRGQVLACPVCGSVAVFQCHHERTGSLPTVPMNAFRAAWLRRTSGWYERMLLTCEGCGYTGPAEAGSTFGDRGGWACAACSGKSPEQVHAARRQVT